MCRCFRSLPGKASSWLAIGFALLSVLTIGCGTENAASSIVQIELMPTQPGQRPLVRVKPCTATLPTSNASFGQFPLLVRRDGKPHYTRLLDPQDVQQGVVRDLDIPGELAGHTWSVALERVVDKQTTQRISNSIDFDPTDTSAVAVEQEAQPIEIIVTDKGWQIDGQLISRDAITQETLEAVLGTSRVTEPTRFMRYLTWDDQGIFVSFPKGDTPSLGIYLRETSSRMDSSPVALFSGKVALADEQVDLNMTVEQAEAFKQTHPGFYFTPTFSTKQPKVVFEYLFR